MAWLLGAAVLVTVVSACGPADVRPAGGPGAQTPQVLTVSTSWQQMTDPATFEARVDTLSGALARLRASTGSGWIGRQDDATGYLGELRGGRFEVPGAEPAVAVEGFMTAFGPDLFGIGAPDLALAPPDAPDRSGTVAIRATQRVGEVPVLDGSLVASVGVGTTGPAVTLVQGRVFPGLAADPTPVLSAAEASAVAAAASGGEPGGEPRLVIVPQGTGAPAWEVLVRSAAREVLSLYYIDAVQGGVLLVRPASADLSPEAGPATPSGVLAAAPVEGTSVVVRGTGPGGQPLTARGLQTGDGTVLLIDTTTPSFDPVTGEGGVQTHDGRSSLPGPIWESSGTTIQDAEAIAAHAFSRFIFDYYLQVHGRLSWDGAGGTLVSSVHGQDGCDNAYFDGSQMVYLDPCRQFGAPTAGTLVDIDVAAHEITHGVTDSTAHLTYTGQSGAMNEAFSDYFGNVIGNRLDGSDDDTVGEGACVGVSQPTGLCSSTPSGELAVRYLPGGQRLDDYLYALTPPYFFNQVLGFSQDQGGVHLNSAIWNNALWSIRHQLAMIDGDTMMGSPRARLFDAIVYTALTRHLTPSSGFLDGRTAVEQAAVEQRADATTLRLIRETFDRNRICPGCVATPATMAQAISLATGPDAIPAVSGDRVAWLSGFLFGLASQGVAGGAGAPVPALGAIYSVGFAGDALVVATLQDTIVELEPNGSARVIDGPIRDDLGVGLAGSEDGAAWVNLGQNRMVFLGPDGRLTRATLPSGIGTVLSVGTGGGTVALGTDSGLVVVWTPSSGGPPEVARLSFDAIVAVDVHGANGAAVVADLSNPMAQIAPLELVLFDAARGDVASLSGGASFFGLTVSNDYAVWAEQVGILGGAVAETFGSLPDTNLHLYSFASGNTYQVLDQRGQQGFPAVSGYRLVWQDAVNGGDDVYTAVLPAGL